MILYNERMYRLPQIVLVLEPNPEVFKIYEGILASSGYLTVFAQSQEEFFKQCLYVVPNIVVVNKAVEGLQLENLCKRLRKHSYMRQIPIVVLVEKIGFGNRAMAKTLEVTLEEFPLVNNQFLQTIKKLSKKMILPDFELSQQKVHLKSELHVELKELSETNLSFLGPLKMNSHCHVKLKAPLLESFGLVEKNFEANLPGTLYKGKQYKNELSLRGISVDVYRKLKKYIMSKKEK